MTGQFPGGQPAGTDLLPGADRTDLLPGADRADLLPGRRTVRTRRFSFAVHRRSVAVTVTLMVLLAVAVTLSLSIGSTYVAPLDVLRALFDGDGPAAVIVNVLRLPRVAAGILAGAALGMAGALFQTVARNPLASPDVLGVTYGASAGAVTVIVLGLGAMSVPMAAGLGGAAAAIAVYLLAWRSGLHAGRFVVVGVALSFALNRFTDLMLAQDEVIAAQQARVWLTGTLNGRGWSHLAPLVVVLVVSAPLLLWAPRGMRVSQLPDDVGVGVGARLGLIRLALIGLGVAYAAAATSAVGPVEFVALASPQLAARLTRSGAPGLLASALVGALMVAVADVIARTVFTPYELPVGVVTAVLGAPYLLWLLARARVGGSG
ncbi:MAG: FecCD family ABC transporter permease [Micromonosporaceae bacterium]